MNCWHGYSVPPRVVNQLYNEVPMQKRTSLAISLIGLIMAGCVTINIYFPAAAAEKAADKIIDEVWQLQKDAKPANSPAENKEGVK